MTHLNHVPKDHTREDYDFEYEDGRWGPIRVVDTVWCRRHGWENEIIPSDWITKEVAYNSPFIYRWTCPTCGKTRNHMMRSSAKFYTAEKALKSVTSHINFLHNGIVPHRRFKWPSDMNEDPRLFVKAYS